MTASTAAVNPKGRLLTRGQSARNWAQTYLTTTVGRKVLVALTGTGLTLFVIFHMAGNLKMLPGGPPSQEAMNSYAHFLKHDLGVWLWAARGGLFALIVLHLGLALFLHRRSAAARPIGYTAFRPAQATGASRTMVLTGLVIGAFIVFHLAHYTFGAVKPAVFEVPVYVFDASVEGGKRLVPPGEPVPYLDLRDGSDRHDVYNMAIAGFRNPFVSAFYIVAQILLFFHLSHGVPSAFQTLGLKSRRFANAIWGIGVAVAAVVLLGNLAIILTVWTGSIGPVAAVPVSGA
jgi:succinate dehydrogenase / fumarate reductase cytochrome b subunit